MVFIVADKGQKPVESHLNVAASEPVRGFVMRKQKRIEQSEITQRCQKKTCVPKKLLQVPEDIQCTTVREPSGFKG